ncbi:LysR substrate-binding domain-containing protein [Orrella dioscoreae]|uniref:Transcriptional regulator, LysR family n=2 Tax=root TaxID=1 RepID=A0A1C3JZ71_9BURK|nr:LysR substrate-binding domain-containing protein [Orrella dioscoreae]SBT24447.1 Transcriptional regulator, LysR family [Orrella dioscoreae]SOE52251.1 Transcriptional regulator, LysR family [Orrella dioscoreae]
MRIASPSMSELHAFVAAARTGSFTRAAEELCVTQGAISRAVARLEAHFGKPLMKRDAHRLELTETGRDLLAAVGEPLSAIELASAGLLRGRGHNELVLSSVPTLASVWLVPRMRDFAARHPEVQVRFVPYRKDEDFSGATPDAAILTGIGQRQWPGLDCTYLIGREVVPVCHPDRAARAQWQAPGDLGREPLLYHTTAPGNWTQWLRAAGAQPPALNLVSGFDQVSILIQAAIADMGVALVQRCLVREVVEQGRLVVPFDLPIELERGYFLCCPPGRSRQPALEKFRQWLLEMAETERASGR